MQAQLDFEKVVYTLQNKGSHNVLDFGQLGMLVVYTLQNKGSHNLQDKAKQHGMVVYTLQNKGSHNGVKPLFN